VAVNPVTDKIYVANSGSNNVTVIAGATNATTTVAVGRTPIALAVNPLTDRIYVANQTSGDVTVIDGSTTSPKPGPPAPGPAPVPPITSTTLRVTG
jgi:YVTN family beta-propeller protein